MITGTFYNEFRLQTAANSKINSRFKLFGIGAYLDLV